VIGSPSILQEISQHRWAALVQRNNFVEDYARQKVYREDGPLRRSIQPKDPPKI
jgi:hypothetical protein